MVFPVAIVHVSESVCKAYSTLWVGTKVQCSQRGYTDQPEELKCVKQLPGLLSFSRFVSFLERRSATNRRSGNKPPSAPHATVHKKQQKEV